MILLKKLTAESAEIYGCDFTGSGKSDTNFPNYHEKLMKIRVIRGKNLVNPMNSQRANSRHVLY